MIGKLFGKNRENIEPGNIVDNSKERTDLAVNNECINEVGDLKVDREIRFMYLALDKTEKPIKHNGDFIFSNRTPEGKEPAWNENEIKGLDAKRFKSSIRFRVKLDSGKSKSEIKEIAKAKLRKLAEENDNQISDYAEDKIIVKEETSIDTDIANTDNIISSLPDENKNQDVSSIKDEIKISEEKIISTINAAKNLIKQTHKDVLDIGDDVAGTVNKAVSKLESPIAEKIQNSTERIQNNINSQNNLIFKNIDDLIKILEINQEQINKTQDIIIEKEKDILKKIKYIDEITGINENIETILGQSKKIDQLDKLVSVISDKGVEITREFPPICEEEEDIINLVRYSKKITEQLGYAARDLIRKKAAFESKEQSIYNERKIIDEKIEQARNNGRKEGQLAVINALLAKYTDIDSIIESNISHIRVIWSMLQEFGVEIDGNGNYKKDNIVTLNNQEIEKMSAIYTKFDGAGKYKVIRTGLIFNNEIVFKAEFKKIIENLNDEKEIITS